MSSDLDVIFSVLASQYKPERSRKKPRGEEKVSGPEGEKKFFKQKFDLSEEEIDRIDSAIDSEMSLNEKFDRIEEVLELLGFEKADHHKDRGLGEFRKDGDYGLKI